MGATTWDYFTPYDPDANAALQRLREQVFREEQNLNSGSSPGDSSVTSFQKEGQMQPGETQDQWLMRVEKLLKRKEREISKLHNPVTPQTIKEFVEAQGEGGTHTILDIEHVSDDPDFGAVSPMPAEELRQLFDTDQPTRKMVEGKLDGFDLVEHPLVAERWQGVYFTVYRDGKPDELYFIGTSGD